MIDVFMFAGLAGRVQQLTKENTELRLENSQLKARRTTNATIDAMQNRIETLGVRIAKQREENTRLHLENNDLKAERKTFVDGVNELNADNNRLRAEVAQLKDKCKSANTNVSTAMAVTSPFIAVIEDEGIATPDELKRRLQFTSSATAADLGGAIDTLLSLQRAYKTLTQP